MFDVNVNRIKNKGMLNDNELDDIIKENTTINPNAFYMGIVCDTNDPHKIGRVRIRVPSIHGANSNQGYFISDQSLPWAKPAIFNCAGNDMGQFLVPTIGTRVFVTFEFNDISKPIYFGGIPTLYGNQNKYYNDNPNVYGGRNLIIDSDDRVLDLDNNSAQQVIFKSIKGATIIINDKDGSESIKIIDSAGQQIIMENKSSVPLPRRGNLTQPPATASISLITNGDLNLTCNKLHINANETNIKDYV